MSKISNSSPSLLPQQFQGVLSKSENITGLHLFLFHFHCHGPLSQVISLGYLPILIPPICHYQNNFLNYYIDWLVSASKILNSSPLPSPNLSPQNSNLTIFWLQFSFPSLASTMSSRKTRLLTNWSTSCLQIFPTMVFNPILDHVNNRIQRLSTISATMNQNINFLIRNLSPQRRNNVRELPTYQIPILICFFILYISSLSSLCFFLTTQQIQKYICFVKS